LFTVSASAQLLAPDVHPKYANDLPEPAVIDAEGGGSFSMDMRETVQWLGLVDAAGQPLQTTVWGYGPTGGTVTYPGPTFSARENVAVDVLWNNALPMTHLLPVDTSLHWANPNEGVATVTHLHGGHTESASDGLPEAWFTQGFAETGPTFVKQLYHYDNDQEAGTLWYHDHALGITRLNVYAGLAGFYLLRDQNEDGLVKSGVLPARAYEREIVIQDRQFDATGQLDLPVVPPEQPGCDEAGPCKAAPVPSAVAEFFGDYILVNGTAWPRLRVEPRKYRLRLLNGSDSRFYVLELRPTVTGGAAGDAKPFLQVGTDDGLLESPVQLTRLLLAPGERAEVVVDFGSTGTVYLRNFGPDDPFKGFVGGQVSCGDDPPGSCVADEATTGQIMKFDVSKKLKADKPEATVALGTTLNSIAPIPPTPNKRSLVLFEGLDDYGRLQPLLGTLEDGSLAWFQEITENPAFGAAEEWEIYNVTEDAHPVHLHLVTFQVINRQVLDEASYLVQEKAQVQHDGEEGVGGKLVITDAVNLYSGPPVSPNPNELGPKDTVVALPGQVTRVRAIFDRTGRYVWHCHILSHEDHEMMRPFCVGDLNEANCGPIGTPLGGSNGHGTP
jgi:spore coat protein A